MEGLKCRYQPAVAVRKILDIDANIRNILEKPNSHSVVVLKGLVVMSGQLIGSCSVVMHPHLVP